MESQYNMVQYNTNHTGAAEPKTCQALKSLIMPHTSPSRASYGICRVRIWENIDLFITRAHSISSAFRVLGVTVTHSCDINL